MGVREKARVVWAAVSANWFVIDQIVNGRRVTQRVLRETRSDGWRLDAK